MHNTQPLRTIIQLGDIIVDARGKRLLQSKGFAKSEHNIFQHNGRSMMANKILESLRDDVLLEELLLKGCYLAEKRRHCLSSRPHVKHIDHRTSKSQTI